MGAVQEDIYVLARNSSESTRLAEQHRVTVELYGSIIHPTILPDLPRNARIADVAGGTDVWAIHAAELLPKSHIVVFDISSAQFPTSWPSNVRFTVANAKEPFPEEELGKYDLVHIRALFAAMYPSDWELVLHNIIGLLKPGGAIQWEEADNSARCLRGTTEYYRPTAIPQVLGKFADALGDRRSDGLRILPQAAISQGLVNVEIDVLSTDRVPTLRRSMSSQYMHAMLGWAEKAAVWNSEELEKIREGVEVDIENGKDSSCAKLTKKASVPNHISLGAYVRLDIMIVVGRRP